MDSHASAAVAAAATLLLVVGCLLARRAYPRPLPGIPYNRAAAGRLLGDMADMAETVRRGGSFRTWFVTQAARHDSAMTQVFLGPFAKPAVVVSDYREVSDILRHRDGVDFKRGLKVEAFGGLLPHAFPAMETFDARFRESRELARDLMTPAVLHAVNAPRIHGVACDLVDLWCLKRRLAGGRPFDVAGDVSEFSFDAILSAAVGLGAGGADADGRPLFDAALGPHLAFSAGNRGCWGKRLGYLELRIVVALLVWSFEFELPAKFVRWDTYDSLVTAPKQCLVRLRELPR